MPEQAFRPEWFSKPGDTLRTLLDKRDLSPVALAECMGRDASVVHGLLSGNVAIDDGLAGQEKRKLAKRGHRCPLALLPFHVNPARKRLST
jgi:hypothetical protein